MPRSKGQTAHLMASPDDVEAQFYEALRDGDIDKLMTLWSDDDEIVCVHPGGPRLVGYDAIRNAWEQIFAGDARLKFRLEQAIAIDTVGLAVQSAIEHVTLADGGTRGLAVATNVFMRTPTGWRIVCHPASPAPPVASPLPAGPLH